MKLNLIALSFAAFTLLIACESNENASPDLVKLLHGKYQPISVTSDQRIDIDNNGVSSTDLLTEMPDIERSVLELRVRKNVNLFSLLWPEQALIPTSNPDEPVIWYLLQSRPYNFEFSAPYNAILLDKTGLSAEDPSELIVPESVQLLSDNTVRVVFTKKFYTRDGWKELSVTALYKRYTTVT